MDSNIEGLVRSCNKCAAQRGLPPVAPLHSLALDQPAYETVAHRFLGD